MHFQRPLLVFVASNTGKRYWDWTLPRIRAQIELSSTFVYDYKMSSSAKNSHLTRGGQTTIMPMPVNRITSQCKKKKLSQKIMPVNKFRTLKFLLILPSMNGQFFLDYCLLCNTCLYRSVRRHGHHCHSSPLAEVGIPRRAAVGLIFWS